MAERFDHIPVVETSPGIYKQVIATDYDGFIEQNITTIKEGKEVKMHGHDGYVEEAVVLKGVGLFSFKQGDNTTHIRMGVDTWHGVILGEEHGIINLGQEDLVLLVFKSKAE